MFKVQNADFIANKLAAELLPDQEFREAFKNAHEAVQRRIAADGLEDGAGTGRIELDVDWHLHILSDEHPWHISCADDGDGMNRAELQKYMTTLAVEGAGLNQSLSGNQGMGLKISGPTRHKRGVLIRSLKDGERSMIQIGWNGREYGLIPLGEREEVIVTPEESAFPEYILERGSGTVVTFLGNETTDGSSENTFKPPARINNWLFKYMNQRFLRLSDDGIDVFVRVPAGDPTEWPETPEEADERSSFNLSRVRGTATVWDRASEQLGDDYRGMLDLPGNAAAGVPKARMSWWVLPTGKGSDVSTRTTSGGSLAICFQNELHDWRAGNQANPFLARLGVLFGKNRFGFILEPQATDVTSDFARAHVLVGSKPVLESDAWLVWADQFREQLPDRIKETMAKEQERLQAEDPDRAKRIRDRLKDVMELLRPNRVRRDDGGKTRAGKAVTGVGSGGGSVIDLPVGPRASRPKSSTPRGIGAALTQVDDNDADPATQVFSMLQLHPKWVTEEEAESVTIVNGNSRGLTDRAAALGGEDGSTAETLLLNRDFRGYRSILSAVNEWGNPDGDEEVAKAIEKFTQEWIEQKMVEAVTGLRQLENGATWTGSHFDDALSPVALTAAFMADRWHTLREVRRQVGPLRRKAVELTEA